MARLMARLMARPQLPHRYSSDTLVANAHFFFPLQTTAQDNLQTTAMSYQLSTDLLQQLQQKPDDTV